MKGRPLGVSLLFIFFHPPTLHYSKGSFPEGKRGRALDGRRFLFEKSKAIYTPSLVRASVAQRSDTAISQPQPVVKATSGESRVLCMVSLCIPKTPDTHVLYPRDYGANLLGIM